MADSQVRGGFLRSIGEASAGALPISVIDWPAGASPLTDLLDGEGWQTADLLAEARRLMAFKRAHGLARTDGPTVVLRPAPGRETVLVIDRQTDEPCPVATPETVYAQMLRAARHDHPTARIVVKRGPAGAIPDDLLALADTVLDGPVDVSNLLAQTDRAYVAGSYMGFEALLLNRPVTSFAPAFYSGLGLTDDRHAAAPRPLRSLEAVFAAAYLLLPRYTDPLTGQPCSPTVAFERLAAFKRHADRVAGAWTGLNIPPAKRNLMAAFLAGPRSTFKPTGAPDDPVARYAVWASRPTAATRSAPVAQVTQIEDGFLRSVGLGSSFHPAGSLVLDRSGIYFDPSQPSDLETLLNTAQFDEEALGRARALRARVVALGLSKYNLPAEPLPAFDAEGRRRILVPGQVEDDASVLRGGGGLSNLALLQRVRADNPEAFIAFKEHPDVTAGNRRGRVSPARARALADIVLGGQDIVACIEAVDEVHTLTSLSGFEALLRGKPVATYGWPFYAGWELTRDLGPAPAPVRRPISLDALVAGALVEYPLYLDPVTWLPCDAFTFVERLHQLREERAASGDLRAPAGKLRRLGLMARVMVAPPRPPPY